MVGDQHRCSRRCMDGPPLSPMRDDIHTECVTGLAAGASCSRCLLRATWPSERGLQPGGIYNLESSEFTSAIGGNEQMDSNCRPVVGALLTNTQVAVYRAFWNRMWLGSWGQQSNYQHLSFLFNEGECGKQSCFQQWDGEGCQGCGFAIHTFSVATASLSSRAWTPCFLDSGPTLGEGWNSGASWVSITGY